MIVSEADARNNKWCPYAWGGRRVNADKNRCIASDCMAWRVVDDEWWRKRTNEGSEDFQKPGGGYCGAFGRPA